MNKADFSEEALVFQNSQGENLVGVLHNPPSGQQVRGVILMMHGWSGYRTGPHQMLTRAARYFSAQGYSCLRFDFAGRGDSDGDADLSTLATMRDDAKIALSLLKSRHDAPVFLLGLCSGCEIAVAAISDEVAGVLLWSAPIFAALPSSERQAKKRGENLKKYARKLLQLSTYSKLFKGQLDTKGISKAVQGQGGAASKNKESNEAGQLPPGFRASSLQNWKCYSGPLLQIYGGADPITEEASMWYKENSGGKLDERLQVEIVEGANHSFYGLAWETQVLEISGKWLRQLVKM
jgi:alpha-beta hydrolase superfamily lysophospholipase